MRTFIRTTLTACSIALLATSSAFADDIEDIQENDMTEATATAAMPSEEEMQKMMALSQPGEHHELLNKMVGDWTYTMTHKMGPDAPEHTTGGISSNIMVMDGRFLEQNVSGSMDMGGQTVPFTGMNLMGYDNMKGIYQSVWIDNMNTGMMTSTATYDAKAGLLKESGTFSCPMKGKDVKFTATLQFLGANTMLYSMMDHSMGKPYKMMEIKYTRK